MMVVVKPIYMHANTLRNSEWSSENICPDVSKKISKRLKYGKLGKLNLYEKGL